MKIVCISENTAGYPNLLTEHGLSIYIETENHKILSDFGGGEVFLKNADALGIDLSKVDIAFLSHGHHDHGDGLPHFLERNGKAAVYLQKTALQPYYAVHPGRKPEYIGLSEKARGQHDRLCPLSGTLRIDDELTVFSGVQGEELVSETNAVLRMQRGNGFEADAFDHEQNLAITLPDGRMVLIAGCAHKGIVNIMERFVALFGKAPCLAIGGFHLTSPGGAEGYSEITEALGHRLLNYPTRYYTCHCTGLPAFRVLKTVMGTRLSYLSTGTVIDI